MAVGRRSTYKKNTCNSEIMHGYQRTEDGLVVGTMCGICHRLTKQERAHLAVVWDAKTLRFQEGDQKNIEWARQWKGLLETLQTFVRQTHTTGLVWNSAPVRHVIVSHNFFLICLSRKGQR